MIKKAKILILMLLGAFSSMTMYAAAIDLSPATSEIRTVMTQGFQVLGMVLLAFGVGAAAVKFMKKEQDAPEALISAIIGIALGQIAGQF